MIPLSVPNLSGNEWLYVKKCLDTGWLSSAGEFVTEFENSIAKYTGANHAVACINGTSGLHLALKVAGVAPNDHVILPNLTFVATANAASYCGAEPILLDIDSGNWQLDLDLLENFLEQETEGREDGCYLQTSSRKISAIVPVHVLGNMCDMERLISIAGKHNIAVVEDAAESLGSFRTQKHSGTFGMLGVLSFNGNKIISTGGGGMLITNDEASAKRLKHLTTQAKISANEYDHDEVGYNYRMVNVLAAIGVAQMEQFEGILERTRHRDKYYRSELSSIEGISFQTVDDEVNPNCWLFTFKAERKQALLDHLEQKQIQARPFWKPMNQLPMFSNKLYVSTNDAASGVYEQCISIPSSTGISDAELEEVVGAIKEFYCP